MGSGEWGVGSGGWGVGSGAVAATNGSRGGGNSKHRHRRRSLCYPHGTLVAALPGNWCAYITDSNSFNIKHRKVLNKQTQPNIVLKTTTATSTSVS